VRVRFPRATRRNRIVFNPLVRFGGGQRRLIYTLRVFCYLDDPLLLGYDSKKTSDS